MRIAIENYINKKLNEIRERISETYLMHQYIEDKHNKIMEILKSIEKQDEEIAVLRTAIMGLEAMHGEFKNM